MLLLCYVLFFFKRSYVVARVFWMVFNMLLCNCNGVLGSGVVVPGEVGILLIYTPNFFFMARERMNDLYHKE